MKAMTVLPVAFAEECAYPSCSCYELRLQKCRGSDTFTLHGLWPQWKEDCSDSFDESQISGIEDQLKQYWLSCPEYGGDNTEFWSHEWKKHGSCSGMDEAAFFQKGLDVRAQYVSQCGNSDTCSICLSEDFATVMECTDGQRGAVIV